MWDLYGEKSRMNVRSILISINVRFLWFESEFFRFLGFLISEWSSRLSPWNHIIETWDYSAPNISNRHKVHQGHATAVEEEKICKVCDVPCRERYQIWLVHNFEGSNSDRYRRLNWKWAQRSRHVASTTPRTVLEYSVKKYKSHRRLSACINLATLDMEYKTKKEEQMIFKRSN